MKKALSVVSLLLLLSSAVFAETQARAAVSKNYLSAQEALANDDFAKAKTALGELAKETQGDVKTKAQAAADAADIKAMRKAFKPLSEAVIKMEMPQGYSVAFCPMYEGGSSWVQKQDKIANPYYGKSMLTCGEFKK